MHCNFEPYEGNDKYIFISYCGKDKDTVQPILENLNNEGFRIWYDYGIEQGTEWPESLAAHIKSCEVLLAFLSNNSNASDWCRKEIAYAMGKKKDIIPIYLEKTELNPGTEIAIVLTQAIAWHQYPNNDKESFYKKIYGTKKLQCCKALRVPKSRKNKSQSRDKTVTEEHGTVLKPNSSKSITDITKSDGKRTPDNCKAKFHDSDFKTAFTQKYQIKGDITEDMILNITELDLSNSDFKLRDVSDLRMFKNLTYLNLEYNKIEDIDPLTELTHLTELDLSGNKIRNITPLAGLINLIKLDLCENEIEDITPLAGLVNLAVLSLSANQISDIRPLAKLAKLTSLNLGSNKIKDIEPLTGLVNLAKLDLYKNQISDITPLCMLVNLAMLYLFENQISDITPLAVLVNLTELSLRGNQISDITPLDKLVNLTELELNGQ